MKGPAWKTNEAFIVFERVGKESVTTIASRIGRSPQAVKQFLYAHGMSAAYIRRAPGSVVPAEYRAEARAKAREMRSQGIQVKDIAAALNASASAVSKWSRAA